MEQRRTKQKATEEVRRRAKEGFYVISRHAGERRAESERDINDLEVLAVIRAGKCVDCTPPGADDKPDWTYTISTRDLSIVVAFRDPDGFEVVTAWENDDDL